MTVFYSFFEDGEELENEINTLIGLGDEIVSVTAGHDGWLLAYKVPDGSDS